MANRIGRRVYDIKVPVASATHNLLPGALNVMADRLGTGFLADQSALRPADRVTKYIRCEALPKMPAVARIPTKLFNL